MKKYLFIFLLVSSFTFSKVNFSGIIGNSGAEGNSFVDTGYCKFAPWQDTMWLGGDGIYLDKGENIWAAGRNGYIYKYSKEGKVLERYFLGKNLILCSKIASDDNFIYFMVYDGKKKKKNLVKMSITSPQNGIENVSSFEVNGISYHLKISGHIYDDCIYISINKGVRKVIKINVKNGKIEDFLLFPERENEKTLFLEVIDINPDNGHLYVSRQVKLGNITKNITEEYDEDGEKVNASKMRIFCYEKGKLYTGSSRSIRTTDIFEDTELTDFNAQYIMGNPCQVREDKEGNIYVAGTFNREILVFDKKGNPIRRIGGVRAAGLTTDEKGNLYVLSLPHSILEVYSPYSKPNSVPLRKRLISGYSGINRDISLYKNAIYFIYSDARKKNYFFIGSTFGYEKSFQKRTDAENGWEKMIFGTAFKTPEKNIGYLKNPFSISIYKYPDEKKAFVYIADTGKNEVIKFPVYHPLEKQKTSEKVNFYESNQKISINQPLFIRFDKKGDLYIATKNKIYRFKRKEGNDFSKIYSIEKVDGNKFSDISGLSVNEKFLCVSDKGKNVIYVFSTDGKLVGMYGEKNVAGNDKYHFNSPSWISISGNNIYVADTKNYRIVKLKIE